MRNFLGLVLSVVLLVWGWRYREISNARAAESVTWAESSGSTRWTPVSTSSIVPEPEASASSSTSVRRASGGGRAEEPVAVPALEAQVKAMSLYPALGVANSPLNLKFLQLYKEVQTRNPKFLTQPDWPLQIAKQAVAGLEPERPSMQVASVPAPLAVALPVERPSAGVPPPQPESAPVLRTSKKVTMYSSSHCPYCKMAKDFFNKNRIKFEEVNIDTSKPGYEAYKRLKGGGVPLILVGQKKVSGFDKDVLEKLLRQ